MTQSTNQNLYSRKRGPKSARIPEVERHYLIPLPLPTDVPEITHDLLSPSTRFELPDGPIKATHREYAAMRARSFRWIADCLDVHSAPQQLVGFAYGRAARIARCCATWRVGTCACGCAEEWNPGERCESLTCPPCRDRLGRRRADLLARFVAEHAPRGRVGYYQRTITLPPLSSISVSELQQAALNVSRVGRKLWDACYSPRASRCVDAAAILDVEIGAQGQVHGHMLRYGPFIRSQRAFDVSSRVLPRIAWAWDGAVWTGNAQGRGQRKQGESRVLRAVRYGTKGVAKATMEQQPLPSGMTERRYEVVHPLVATLFELATHGWRRHRTYGGFRGLKGLGRKKATSDLDRAAPHARCGECGSEIRWRVESYATPMLPVSWADNNFADPPAESLGIGNLVFGKGGA